MGEEKAEAEDEEEEEEVEVNDNMAVLVWGRGWLLQGTAFYRM